MGCPVVRSQFMFNLRILPLMQQHHDEYPASSWLKKKSVALLRRRRYIRLNRYDKRAMREVSFVPIQTLRSIFPTARRIGL